MTKKYKILLQRNECIGAGPCTAILPDFWTLNQADDGRVDFKEPLQPTTLENGDQELIIELTQEQLDEQLEAAQSCPVHVIHIYEEETGKKLH